MSERRLIVNADDFGQSAGVNRGVVHTHEQGIVTSASLMVRWPASRAAAAYARSRPRLSVGLHVDLGEWRFAAGRWTPLYEAVDTADPPAVEAEVRAQLEAFRELVGRDPTHLDSHQHVHSAEPVGSVLVSLAGELGVPLRHFDPRVRYCGDFYGQGRDGSSLPQAITVERLIEIVRGVPPGTTELGCHPAESADLVSDYAGEREVESSVLCDRRVRAALEKEGIALCSFADLLD